VRRTDPFLAAAFFLTLSPAAQAAAQRQPIDVRAGRLGDAIIALGQQTGSSIGVRDPALAARRVPAVRGRLGPEEALRKLLAGSGTRAVTLGPRTFLVVAAPRAQPKRRAAPKRPPPRPLPPPRPEAVADVEPQPEIIVTGSRRALALSAYPGTATLLDGDDPLLAGVRGSEALVERVPGVTSTHLGPGRNKLFLRGIADSSFNGPTQATVGQYVGETRLNYNAPDPDLRLHDIRRIEILQGPQGTLYGAGALGGVVRVLPNAPDTVAASASAALGASLTRHGDASADGAAVLNLPLVSGAVALRLSGYAETEGGYIDDLQRGLRDVNRTRIWGGRAALRAETASGWTVDLALTAQRIRGEDAQFADRDAPPLSRRSPLAQDYRNKYALADVTISRDWGDLHLVSATGIVRQSLLEHYDSTQAGGPPTLFAQSSRIQMISSDTRLWRQSPSGAGWLFGASLVSNRARQERALGSPGALRPITGVRNGVREATLYGEASVALAEDLILTGGGRITHSRLSGAALDVPLSIATMLRAVSAERAETSFLPSVALSARPLEGLSLFARYQHGFRPGGLAVTGDIVHRFRNDQVATAEGGLRFARPGLGGFDIAASAAFTRWKNIQADVIDFSGLPTTANIGDGRIYTLDLRLGWRPFPGLSLDLGAVLNRSRVTNPVPTIIISPSAPLPNVARLNARFGAEYHAALLPGADLRFAGSARYVGKSRLGIGPVLGEPQGGWLDTRLSAELDLGTHSLSLIVSNLLDEKGNRFAFGSPFTLVDRRQTTPLRPRTVRLGWEVRF
jgi:outer membrane receptor protein involved in Fe transport